MVELLTTLTLPAAVPPKLTLAPARKLLPLMLTAVPPPVGPELGETEVTLGAGLVLVEVKPLARVPLCPSLLVTTTLTAPAAWAGVVAVMVELLTTVTLPAAVPPKLTPAPARKLLPLMLTAVPPPVGPELGETELTLGAGLVLVYVKPLARVPLCPSLLVTTTLTAPAAWAGVVAVMVELLTTVTLPAAVPPKLTLAPARKLLPLMLTAVPPPVGPELGETELTLGAGLVFEAFCRKAAICITQLPEALRGAVAL